MTYSITQIRPTEDTLLAQSPFYITLNGEVVNGPFASEAECHERMAEEGYEWNGFQSRYWTLEEAAEAQAVVDMLNNAASR